MKKTVSFLFALIAIAFVLASCEKPAQKQEMAKPAAEQKAAARLQKRQQVSMSSRSGMNRM